MPADPAAEQPIGSGASAAPDDAGAAAAERDPEHDETTSREAYEREMAEEGRSDEAGRHGDHID
jgi:hypothetical protein